LQKFVIDCHCWICWWQIFGICCCRWLYIYPHLHGCNCWC